MSPETALIIKQQEQDVIRRECIKRWRNENRGKVNAWQTRGRMRNPSKALSSRKVSRCNNPVSTRRSHKKYHYRVKYGLTLSDVELMREAQDNKCALCGNEFNESKKAAVDHCHTTGKVRGLLCTPCNTQLSLADRIGVGKIQEYLLGREVTPIENGLCQNNLL